MQGMLQTMQYSIKLCLCNTLIRDTKPVTPDLRMVYKISLRSSFSLCGLVFLWKFGDVLAVKHYVSGCLAVEQ